MKHQSLALTSTLLFAICLSSCASKLTPAQQASLSTVMISPTTVDPEAYEEPYGGDLAMRERSSNVPNAGILGPLVGAAIGGTVAGVQNSNFNSDNKHHFSSVQRNVPANVGGLMDARLAKSLGNDPFFKSRLRKTSVNRITSEISCHRLIRTGKNEHGELLFSPQIYVDIHLKGAAGESLVGKTYIATSPRALSIARYAASAEETKQSYTEAMDGAIVQFQSEVAIKTSP